MNDEELIELIKKIMNIHFENENIVVNN